MNREYLCVQVLLAESYLEAGDGWAFYTEFCLLPEAQAFKGLFLFRVVIPS